ncbi:MAG: HAD-IA family hydrolase [Deltaproteobacteria bacterium]|nr:HAD-IA family hydrolase [Deltaproteobacteria bacterium]
MINSDNNLKDIKALAFDVGGTVVDWHTGISRQLSDFGKERGIEADWVALTKAWRMQGLRKVINKTKAEVPRGNIDGAHREALDSVLSEAGIDAFSAQERDEMILFWHRLDSWPDAAGAHARLRKKFTMATLTILSVSLIIDISRRAPFHWDAVFSCEFLDHYKMHPSVYQSGVRMLQLEPHEVMMVAAHNMDLRAAHEQGLRTAFIHRPVEWGERTTPEQVLDSTVDIVADDMEALADQLGA